jgi:hypothetical protein
MRQPYADGRGQVHLGYLHPDLQAAPAETLRRCALLRAAIAEAEHMEQHPNDTAELAKLRRQLYRAQEALRTLAGCSAQANPTWVAGYAAKALQDAGGGTLEDNPAADALDKLWRDIILVRRPSYGDWEYPGQAYRHLLAEFNELGERALRAERRLTELALGEVEHG